MGQKLKQQQCETESNEGNLEKDKSLLNCLSTKLVSPSVINHSLSIITRHNSTVKDRLLPHVKIWAVTRAMSESFL